MRWFNLRRVLAVLFLLPPFIALLVINRIFLLLDHLFFPKFLQQEVRKPVFIVSAPRSATTYLFHTLAESDRFTCFKLWEIIFAPSICQKLLILKILALDKNLGEPLRKSVFFVENKLIGNIKKIHLIGLNLPEEDEAVLLWDLSSFYLNFFYPDSQFFDKLVLFDTHLSNRQKNRIMRSYASYIKRHNYVFNRDGSRQHLSKNPLMMSKVGGIASIFTDAMILNINRCPSKTLPSTLELNRNLYALFTSRPVPDSLNAKSLQILIAWYRMCEENLQRYFANQHLKMDFNRLVKQEPVQIQELADFLQIPVSVLTKKREEHGRKHVSDNTYKPLSDEALTEILEELPFMVKYCAR